MQDHRVRVYPSAQTPPRQELLAWKLAAVAADDAPLDRDVIEMVVNRVIDNAGVAVAGPPRHPGTQPPARAAAHPPARGPARSGLPRNPRLGPQADPRAYFY